MEDKINGFVIEGKLYVESGQGHCGECDLQELCDDNAACCKGFCNLLPNSQTNPIYKYSRKLTAAFAAAQNKNKTKKCATI